MPGAYVIQSGGGGGGRAINEPPSYTLAASAQALMSSFSCIQRCALNYWVLSHNSVLRVIDARSESSNALCVCMYEGCV